MTPDQLRTYINTYIVQNGLGLIQGQEHNNVDNNMLDFIISAPLNWQKAKVYNSTTPVNTSRPVNVFMNTPPATLIWGDNIYNEFIFINTTTYNIPFSGGKSFYDKNGNVITYIPANQSLNIMKAENGLWIQSNNFSSTSTISIQDHELDFTVGQGSPITMNEGDTVLTISDVNIIINSVKIFLDGGRMYPGATDQATYGIVYNSNSVVITFNMDGEGGGVLNNQKFVIDYATSF